MPAPMMQPMPSEIRLAAESVRCRLGVSAPNSASCASAFSAAIDFLIHKFVTLILAAVLDRRLSPSPKTLVACLRHVARILRELPGARQESFAAKPGQGLQWR